MTTSDSDPIARLLRIHNEHVVVPTSLHTIERRARRRVHRRRTAAVATVATSMLVALVIERATFTRDTPRQEIMSSPSGPPETIGQAIDTTDHEPVLVAPGRWTASMASSLRTYPGAARGVWSGDRLLVWTLGITDGDLKVGASYEPSTETWQPLARAPLSPRYRATQVWTDAGLVVWGGSTIDGQPLDDGALYSPESGRWTMLPSPPAGSAMANATPLWTGREVIFAGGVVAGEEVTARVLSYSPSLMQWQQLSDAPLRLQAPTLLAIADKVMMVGSRLDNNNATLEHGAAVYTPGSGWAVAASPPFSPQSNAAAPTGSNVLVVDYLRHAWVLDVVTLQWTAVSDIPTNPQECYIAAAAMNTDAVYIDYCGTQFLYRAGQWERLAPGPGASYPISTGGTILSFTTDDDGPATPTVNEWTADTEG
jgi:Galactose oxidase, central domain